MDHNTLRHLKRFKWKYEVNPRLDVLEVGSRAVNGEIRQLFREHQYIGVDIEPGPGVDRVVTGEWFRLDLQVNVVLCANTLERVKYPQTLIKSMAEHLHHGGLCYIQAPFAHPYHRHPIDTFRYAPDGLEHLAESAGIKVQECYLYHSSLVTNFPAPTSIRFLQHCHGVLRAWWEMLRFRHIPSVHCVLVGRKGIKI